MYFSVFGANGKLKAKYTQAGPQGDIKKPCQIKIENHTFERVYEFVYLGSWVISDNDIKPVIQRKMVVANKCYSGLHKNRAFSRSKNIIIYKTLIRSSVDLWLGMLNTRKIKRSPFPSIWRTHLEERICSFAL